MQLVKPRRQNHGTCCSFHETKEETENSHKHLQIFLHKLNTWNSPVNFTCPPPAHLKYQYPPPTPAVLHNISCTLASVPKFYTQVLHLMNKMNLPCPFQPMPFPKPETLSSSVPLHMTEGNPNVPQEPVETMELSEEEESELESDGEGQQLPADVIPAKRSLPHKPKKVKRPKFIKPVPAVMAPVVKSIKPEEVFEKVTCEPIQRKIELKFSTAPGGDGVVDMMDEHGTSPSGGFGLMFPVPKNGDDVESAKNTGITQEEETRGSTITAEELEANRISPKGKYNFFCDPIFGPS